MGSDLWPFTADKAGHTVMGMGIAVWLAKILIANALKDIKEIQKSLVTIKTGMAGILATLSSHTDQLKEVQEDRKLILEHDRKLTILMANRPIDVAMH